MPVRMEERDGRVGWPASARIAAMLLVLAALAGRAAGCSGGREEPAASRSEPEARSRASSLEVGVGPMVVRLRLYVTNAGADADTLSFPTAQRYDFAVLDSAGLPVWRWSEGRMFAQQLGREVLESGQTVTYTAEWEYDGRRGRYTAVGRLSGEGAVEVRREFDLPGG